MSCVLATRFSCSCPRCLPNGSNITSTFMNLSSDNSCSDDELFLLESSAMSSAIYINYVVAAHNSSADDEDSVLAHHEGGDSSARTGRRNNKNGWKVVPMRRVHVRGSGGKRGRKSLLDQTSLSSSSSASSSNASAQQEDDDTMEFLFCDSHRRAVGGRAHHIATKHHGTDGVFRPRRRNGSHHRNKFRSYGNSTKAIFGRPWLVRRVASSQRKLDEATSRGPRSTVPRWLKRMRPAGVFSWGRARSAVSSTSATTRRSQSQYFRQKYC